MTPDRLGPPRWLRWAAVVFVAGGIFYASVLVTPSPGGPEFGPLGVFGLDKWLHATGYAALAGALAVALAPDFEVVVAAVLAVLLAFGYGVGIEFVQAPIPTRHFSVADMAANGVGALVGIAVWRAGTGFVRRLILGGRSKSA